VWREAAKNRPLGPTISLFLSFLALFTLKADFSGPCECACQRAAVHQRSLINVDDPTSTGATVRLKRNVQAEYLASLIQSYQAAGEHVVTVGDYDSFEFSDGFVDVLGVTRGDPAPTSQVITAPTAMEWMSLSAASQKIPQN
jgi:hypothetical protein